MANELTSKKILSVLPTAYLKMMRLHRPIGIYLVLWPTLWALWLAAEGAPDTKILIIFIIGCVLMRSAGCIINDFADREIDTHVRRTQDRPLATGEVSVREALALFGLLCALAFVLVLFTNMFTIKLAFVAMALAVVYPFVKRFSQLPQIVLGAAFAWSVPMAFAAQTDNIPQAAWLVYVAVLLWTVCYDTFYAMVDREDDLRIGVKSTAILFGDMDRAMTASLQILTILTMIMVGTHFELKWPYYLGLACAGGFFVFQQLLIREREPEQCFRAFLNNNWAGMAIFLGIVAHYAVYVKPS